MLVIFVCVCIYVCVYIYTHTYIYTYICCCPVAKPCPIICDPMDRSTPGFPVLHHLLEFAQVSVP